VNDLLVGFEPEGANEGHEVNRARDGRERHFEQPFTVALAKHQRTVPAALGERLCDLDPSPYFESYSARILFGARSSEVISTRSEPLTMK